LSIIWVWDFKSITSLIYRINKKTIIKGGVKSNIYYINEGVYGCFNNIITDKAEIHINTFKSHIPEVKCTIFGPSCDSLDCIAKDIMLPELDVGDYIYVENMGAYTTSCSNNFNGFPAAKVKYIMY
jgi:ornithine decarboxylase